MRKLAREAVIFALLGMVVGAVGSFALLTKDIRTHARLAGAEAVHATIGVRTVIKVDLSRSEPISANATIGPPITFVLVPLTTGTMLYVRQCEPIAWTSSDCRLLSNPYRLTPLPLGDLDQVAIEKDYWAAYKKSEQQTLFENGIASLYIGLWGFPGGLGIWGFYRLVRFAIKG